MASIKTMLKFRYIIVQYQLEEVINILKQEGFTEVKSNESDKDFIVIDQQNQEYIWCENGFAPFCSYEELHKNKDLNIDELVSLIPLYIPTQQLT